MLIKPFGNDEASARDDSNIDPFGTTIRYTGNNEDLRNTDANRYAELAHRATVRQLSGDTSVKIDTDSGKITVTAPQGVLNNSAAKRLVDGATLKSLSQAYKSNNDYKITYTEVDENGENKEVVSNIPDYIEKLNESLANIQKNSLDADRVRYHYVKDLGYDKADKLDDDQIRMTQNYTNGVIPIPEFIANSEYVKGINKVLQDGAVTEEEFRRFYNRDRMGHQELAGFMGEINARLKYADYNEDDYYVDDEGNKILDQNSANEMAKALAVRNYILDKDPEANLLQSVGDTISSLGTNVIYGFDRVFFNIANIAEMGVNLLPGVEADAIQNYIKDYDTAFQQWNEEQALVNDATTGAAVVGQLTGTIAATIALGKVIKAAGRDIHDAASLKASQILEETYNSLGADQAARGALSISSIANIAAQSDDFAIGTIWALRAMGILEKASAAASVASAFLQGHQLASWAASFLLDTVHDAFLYDSTTLREALAASDQKTRDYWLGQLADNAKWWGGMAVAKAAFRGAKLTGQAFNQTTLGKAMNVRLSRVANKIAVSAGDKYRLIRDAVHGGDVVRDLEEKLKTAIDKGDTAKANRIMRKIEQEQFGSIVREARRALADAEFEWDGMKLTDESAKRFDDLQARIMALENSIDSYHRNIDFKRQEMLGTQIDPSTGRAIFVNPSLGGANVKTSNFYMNLADLNAKYKIPTAEGSLIGQDVINYAVGSYHYRIMSAIAGAGGTKSSAAASAAEVIQKNLDDLREKLPEEIIRYVDDNPRAYTDFYGALNEYGKAKGLVNIEKINSYESNPIWAENGYMPVRTEIDTTGRWVADDGGVNAVIEQDFNQFTYSVKQGQNYMDPELVRQTRISNMARAEINRDLYKAYSGFGSDATNIVKLTGEDTQYAQDIASNKASFNSAIKQNVSGFSENFNVEVRRHGPAKGVKVEKIGYSDRSRVISQFSPNDTAQILSDRKVLPTPDAKMTDGVAADNYTEWYNKQSRSVKNYLQQQYSNIMGGEVNLSAFGLGDDYQSLKVQVSEGEPFAQYAEEHIIGKSPRKNTAAGKALDSFFGNAGLDKGLNRKLRTGEALMPQEQKLVTNLRKAFTQNIDTDTAVFRGMRTSDSYKVGDTFVDPGFGYVSVDSDIANLYSLSGKQSDRQTIFLYHLKDGQEIAMPKPKLTNDREFLLPDGFSGTVSAVWDDAQGVYAKGARIVEIGEPSGYSAMQKAMEIGGADFEAGLQRAYLIGDEGFSKSAVLNEAVRNIENGEDAFYAGVVNAAVKGRLRHIHHLEVDQLVDDLSDTFKNNIEDYVNNVLDEPGAKAAINTFSERVNGSDVFGRYVVLEQLSDPKLKEEAYEKIDNEINKLVKGKNIFSDDVNTIKKQAHVLFDDILENKLNAAALSARSVDPDLIASDGIFEKADNLAREIESLEKKAKNRGTNTIMYLDSQGRQVFAEADPAFASLFNRRFIMQKAEASGLAKINALMSKAFRYGTTSVNLSSFGNQLFRDSGNALMVGGAWQTIRTNADNLSEVFGPSIVEQIKNFDPTGYEMRQVEQLAADTGVSIERAAVSRELARGASISPTTTERTLYRDFMKQAYGGDDVDTSLTNMKNKFQEFIDKYNPDELMNGKRENYLRNRVYASALNEGMQRGYTLEQSRVFAEFAMNNATTNFSRQLYHMQAIADSTPYFRAAINGTKSFWRMWSLDPVGISGRIMGGLILPTMFLTGASLGDKESREIYKNIPEYQKQDKLLFVVDKQIISVPIPQEMSAIVSPFRQFVEYLYDANPNDFWELMANDLLGFSPVDLTAFTAVDMDAMISDPTVMDRIDRGFARVFSQMAPVPAKTVYMLLTKTDPYSGKKLNRPLGTYWNDETGALEVMDYTQNSFAKLIAQIWGDEMSPQLAEKVVSGILGTTGSNVLGDLAALFMEGPDAWMASVGNNVVGQLTSPFHKEVYDLADSVWGRAVRELTAEKNAVLNSSKMKTLNQELQQQKNPDERQKLLSARQDLVNDYQQKVVNTIKRLESVYGGTFDRKKLAASIALLNFNTDPIYQSGSISSSATASNSFWDGYNGAIHTMQQLGVTGTNDLSIFGYLTTDANGKIVLRYNNPIAIMDMENVWQSQDDAHLANIKALASSNDLWDKKKSVDAQVDAIYAKGKLTNSDYNAINAIYINWNAEVMSALAPYVQEMSPEAAINNSSVLDYLDGLIEVPSDFKKDKYGRYVTNKKLGEGSASQAYIRNYIKKIFKVNDTGYAGGKNYSGR